MLLFCFGISAAGCAGIMPSVESPRVTVAELRVQEIRHFETTLEVDLRVINPNDFDLVIDGVACDLELNGERFGSGVSRSGTTIAAFSTGMVTLDVYSSMITLFRELLRLPEREELAYVIKGSVRAAAKGHGKVTVPFESRGRFNFKGTETVP